MFWTSVDLYVDLSECSGWTPSLGGSRVLIVPRGGTVAGRSAQAGGFEQDLAPCSHSGTWSLLGLSTQLGRSSCDGLPDAARQRADGIR